MSNKVGSYPTPPYVYVSHGVFIYLALWNEKKNKKRKREKRIKRKRGKKELKEKKEN